MARSAFEAVIELQLKRYSPEEAKRQHIAIAKAGLAQFLSEQSARPMVSIEVDGHSASSENQVRPFGVITYRFSRMREVASFALREAERLSPVASGRYRKSWFLMQHGRQVGMDQLVDGIPFTLCNDQPYSRKIHVGAKGFEKYAVPSGIVEKVRQLVLKRYRPIVEANIQFIDLTGGYKLKQSLRQLRPGGRRGTLRRDSMAGSQIRYPALVVASRL